MCGIAGFVAATPLEGAENALARMTAVLVHRGPDDAGFYHDAWAALGHRRLSIIDLAGGHQPMANRQRSRWIVYNGEIFNHAALRPELERLGHDYRTRSDTESILHAYAAWGAAAVERFRGMFAFAIWDAESRTLFCARDRLGIKPFYYYFDGRLFVFASEIKALLEHPTIAAQLDEEVLAEHLAFGYTSDERTLFAGIRKLMPGHLLELGQNNGALDLSIRRYWDLAVSGEPAEPDERFWIAETRRRLEETVRMRLMSDVPLGMFLSGGIDSSAIAAIMRRITDGPVKTFAVGYSEDRFSELSYAAAVARAIGTEHHEVRVGMEDFFAALPRLIWHEDEPIAWPSSVSLYFVSRLASEQVKVVLTGEGSDEMFGGYERYRWNLINLKAARFYGLAPECVRGAIRGWIARSRLLNGSLRRKLGHTILGRSPDLESLFLDNFYCAFPAREQAGLLCANSAGVYDNYRRYYDAWPEASLVARMLYADQKTYLVELLMKQDQMSMACSIESRVPFLDHTFVEFAMRVPDRLKISGSVQKYVLKKAVEGLLPAGIIHRKKMGFPTPLRQWLREERAKPIYEALRDPDGILAAHVDRRVLNGLIENHLSGVEDATDRVWRLLNLQVWGDLFLTGRRSRWWDGSASAAPSSLSSRA